MDDENPGGGGVANGGGDGEKQPVAHKLESEHDNECVESMKHTENDIEHEQVFILF